MESKRITQMQIEAPSQITQLQTNIDKPLRQQDLHTNITQMKLNENMFTYKD